MQNISDSNHISIVGLGPIGCGWAARFASAGAGVWLADSDTEQAEAGVSRLRTIAQTMATMSLIDDESEIMDRCTVVASLEKLPAHSEYVQESVTENPNVKNSVFRSLDEIMQPHCVLASSTSALVPEQFLEDIPGRNRCIIAHPFNPPHIMPLVEIVKTPWVDNVVVSRTIQFLKTNGQVPIVLNKAVPGLAANRLQAAVVNEAISLVADGVISATDVELCMTQALGLRWCFLGPFRTMDLNSDGGFLEYATKFGKSYSDLGRSLNLGLEWPQATLENIEESLRKAVPKESLPQSCAERDRLVLMAAKLAQSFSSQLDN
jgi:3-hydroxyacyl-CoA dehydrogenase